MIIVNWNSTDLLAICLASVEQWLRDLSFEAVVVDNCSAEEDVLKLKQDLANRFSWARFVYNSKNLGFAQANNLALQMANGKYILLLNPDTCFISGGFAKLPTLLESGGAGMVSCKLLNRDRSIQESCFYFPSLGRILFTALLLHKILPHGLRRKLCYSQEDHQQLQRPDWVLGAFMLLPRTVMLQLGGFDEDIFMYGEDMDLCYRLKKLGRDILYVPDLEIIHYGGCSGGQAWPNAKKQVMVYRAIFYFYRKYYGRGKLVLARGIYSLGALLRMLGYGISCLKPSRFQHGINEIKTQSLILFTLLGFR